MSNHSSPSRSTSVKVQYTVQAKRKQSRSKTRNEGSDSEDNASETELHSPESKVRNRHMAGKSLSSMHPPDVIERKSVSSSASKGSPSQRVQSSEEPLEKTPKKKGHVRNASSVSSLNRIAVTNGLSTPSPSGVPVRKPASSKDILTRDVTPDSPSKFTRRTEAERIKYFEEDTNCGLLEPNRAECIKCKKFVSLGNRQTYAVRPWENHRNRCDKNASNDDDRADDESDSGSTAAPSISASAVSEHTPRRTEAERKSILETDPRAEEVRPNEVLCRKCQKTIRLSTRTKYALTNWNAHQLRCGDISTTPSTRVVAMERKLAIVNDPMVKAFTHRSVDCKMCDTHVDLVGDVDYDLTQWVAHKAVCPKKSINEPSNRPPPSTTSSTGTTLIASENSPARRGTKRARESDDELEDNVGQSKDNDISAPPTNKPRTETYTPVNEKPPSILGWFALPFQAFIRGFRESLPDDSKPE